MVDSIFVWVVVEGTFAMPGKAKGLYGALREDTIGRGGGRLQEKTRQLSARVKCPQEISTRAQVSGIWVGGSDSDPLGSTSNQTNQTEAQGVPNKVQRNTNLHSGSGVE